MYQGDIDFATLTWWAKSGHWGETVPVLSLLSSCEYASDDELLVFRNAKFWFDHDFLDDPLGPGRSIAASFLAKGDKGLVEEVVPLGDPHPEIES